MGGKELKTLKAPLGAKVGSRKCGEFSGPVARRERFPGETVEHHHGESPQGLSLKQNVAMR